MDTPPPPPPVPPPSDDTVSTIIPYRNMPALFAYYCGVFSLIPCLGGILGPVALILGIVGLRVAANQPTAKGRVHAWIGIILGGLIFLVHLAFVVVSVIGASQQS